MSQLRPQIAHSDTARTIGLAAPEKEPRRDDDRAPYSDAHVVCRQRGFKGGRSRRRIESGKEAVDLKGWLTGSILTSAGQAAVPIARTLLPFQKEPTPALSDEHVLPYISVVLDQIADRARNP